MINRNNHFNYPLLFNTDETSFTTQGLGVIDPLSCIVTEERNGEYQLEMDIEAGSMHADLLKIGRLILSPVFPVCSRPDWEPFEIAEIEHSISQIIHVRAWHVSYRLAKVCVMPFTVTSASTAFPISNIWTAKTCVPSDCGFALSSGDYEWDPPQALSFKIDEVRTLRSLLGGEEGSILDTFHGEYKWKRFTVHFYPVGGRGKESKVLIKYGTNLTKLSRQLTAENVYTGIVPYWKGDDGNGNETIVTLPEKGIYYNRALSDWYSEYLYVPVDFTGKFNSVPSASDLRIAAQTYLYDNAYTSIPENIDVSFVQDPESNNIYMQNLRLCDTVTIKHEKMGLSYTAMVTKTVFNVLLDRYDEISVSTEPVTLNRAIRQVVRK